MAAALLLSGCSSATTTNHIVESLIEESTANIVDEALQNAVWNEITTEVEEEIQNIEWNDVKDSVAEKKQKIELRSITDDTVLHTITDNQQIFEFTRNLYIGWKSRSSIPKDAKDLLVYVTWTSKTRTVLGNNTGEIYETSRNTLYKNKDGYYLLMELSDDVPSPIRKFYSEVPAKAAEYLLSLAGAENK